MISQVLLLPFPLAGETWAAEADVALLFNSYIGHPALSSDTTGYGSGCYVRYSPPIFQDFRVTITGQTHGRCTIHTFLADAEDLIDGTQFARVSYGGTPGCFRLSYQVRDTIVSSGASASIGVWLMRDITVN